MKRLTTETPKNTTEATLNFCTEENGQAVLHFGEKTIPLVQYVANTAYELHCFEAMEGGVLDGNHCTDCDCPAAVMNMLGIQAAENNARLKMLENIFGDDYDLTRLQELVAADKDDRIVIRPVKLGTPVWSTVFCRIDDDGVEHPTYPWDFSDSMLPEWGVGWHLTEADALKALEDDLDIDDEEDPDDPND